ncbi:MAG: hypothetical protein Q7O12_08620 [Deltaproteobacteria bacterium]|nr:hypothetical protein [Deltaproteobacteria bacterium]
MIYKTLKYIILPLSVTLIAGYILLCASPNIVMVFKNEFDIGKRETRTIKLKAKNQDIKSISPVYREEITRESFVFYNKSIIPGFIDKVEITPETVFKPFVKIEVIGIDKRKLNFFWSFFYPEVRTVKVKYTYTDSLSINEKGALIKEETIIAHTRWCFFDNKGQFVNCFDKLIISLREQKLSN